MTCMERGKKKRHIRRGDIRHIRTVDMMEKGHKVHSKKTYTEKAHLHFDTASFWSTNCIGYKFCAKHQLHWAQLFSSSPSYITPAASGTAFFFWSTAALDTALSSSTSCIKYGFLTQAPAAFGTASFLRYHLYQTQLLFQSPAALGPATFFQTHIFLRTDCQVQLHWPHFYCQASTILGTVFCLNHQLTTLGTGFFLVPTKYIGYRFFK